MWWLLVHFEFLYKPLITSPSFHGLGVVTHLNTPHYMGRAHTKCCFQTFNLQHKTNLSIFVFCLLFFSFLLNIQKVMKFSLMSNSYNLILTHYDHILIVQSLPPETIYSPILSNMRHCTASSCPTSDEILPCATSYILIVLSLLATAST